MKLRKPIVYSTHARQVMRERRLESGWVERTAIAPEWVSIDPARPEIERRFAAIAEMSGRILRVAVVETADEIRIVTAFLDRRAGKSK